MELWELAARESVRDCIARWNAHGDAGRVDAMVEVLAPEVEFQAADSPVLRGRQAVLDYLGGLHGTPDTASASTKVATGRYVPAGGRPGIRHFTSTTYIELLSETSATVRTYYAVLTSHGLDHWGRYLDDFGVVEGDWLITKRVITTEGLDPEGWAASFA